MKSGRCRDRSARRSSSTSRSSRERGVGPRARTSGNRDPAAVEGRVEDLHGRVVRREAVDRAVFRNDRRGAAVARVPIQGELVTRDDVSRMLIKCAEWFDRYEPSSPVPILIRRANKLINKDFLEVLRDIAPDGVAQAEFFRGEDEEPDYGI